jgi:hypothetical protein
MPLVRDCRDIESALFIFEVLHSEECPKTEKCPVRNGKLDAKYANVPLKEGGFALELTHESGVIKHKCLQIYEMGQGGIRLEKAMAAARHEGR